MSNCNKTHKLITKTLGSQVTRTWISLATGMAETDAAVVASLEVAITDTDCDPSKPDCVESQEWTYGIDNTGTNYADTATYRITLSNGQTLTFEQTPTTGWSNQLTQWAANIQTVADDAGLTWFADPRAVNNVVPSDISGGYGTGSTPTGLPGAPSVPIAQGLIDGGMGARYVNIQICPAQPVPTKVERITSATYTNNPYSLNTAGAILGPTNRFFVCRNCGEGPVWYLDDGVTEASAGQIPSCYVPCGTLSLTEAPPESECQFFFADGCDNNNSTDSADFTSGVTRRSTICSDGNISLDYFVADPADDSALISYDLMGSFVDCATGEEVVLPDIPCGSFEIVTLFKMSGELDGALNNREWHDTAPVISLVAGTDKTPEGRNFRETHDFSLVPDTVSTQTSLFLNDANNVAVELDIQVIDGFVEVADSGWFRYSGTSEGYWAVELGECGSPLELLAENGGFSPTRSMEFYLPAGIHQIRLWNIDSAGSNSSATFGYSIDGGVTYINDNTPPNITFGASKITEECVTVKVCEDSGEAFNLVTGEAVDITEFYPCPRTCTAPPESSGACDEYATEVEQTIQSGKDSNVPAGFHTVTINSLGGTTTVDGGFELGTGRRVDTISFDSTNHSCINGVLPAITLTGGEWQWIGVK